ncbi:MAG TPA: hypothetical protein VM533_06160 [Fimbriiglobus sp.]|jgi:hypothetical protein|nr:hypothetical protein [Fimbriiglobus sp.]
MRRARKARLVLVASAAWAAASGCDAQPRATSSEARTVPTAVAPARHGDDYVLAPAPQAHKPDLARLGFDPSTRTLTLYELTDTSARWMLASPATPAGVPLEREYKFPPEVDLDLDRVAVFYTVPNRRPSPTVSLREIIDARETRVLR